MAELKTQLRDGRTVEEMYSDVALVYGYKEFIEEDVKIENLTKEEAEEYKCPTTVIKDSKKVKSMTTTEGTTYIFDYKIKVPNPQTETEFAIFVIQKSFAAQDVDMEAKAATIRAKKAYGIE